MLNNSVLINFTPLLCHIAFICGVHLICLKIGEKALNAWLCVVAIAMNLFVSKQINILGLHVTASESLAVGYLLGLSLIQEFFGKKAARQHVYISMTVSVGFLGLGWAQISYCPNDFDMMHPIFVSVFQCLPRIIVASLVSFFVIQLADIAFFQYLRSKTQGRWFSIRTGICLLASQLMDTLIFSYLGLYGLVENIYHIMIVSFMIKGVVIILSLPYLRLSKMIMKIHKPSLIS